METQLRLNQTVSSEQICFWTVTQKKVDMPLASGKSPLEAASDQFSFSQSLLMTFEQKNKDLTTMHIIFREEIQRFIATYFRKFFDN